MSTPPPRSSALPRKVLVGTCVFDTYRRYRDLDHRTNEVERLLDRIVVRCVADHPGCRLDIVVLPEDVLSDKDRTSAEDAAIPFDSPLIATFRAASRRYSIYLILPVFLREGSGIVRNAALLFDRQGDHVGTYAKMHPVLDASRATLEGGVVPGTMCPVFECDFGKIGIQICFDVMYDDGWSSLSRDGADVVFWPTESPQTVRPARLALNGGYYIVSSTTRCNATIFNPTGRASASASGPDAVLVHEIDLSYSILNWSAPLRAGALLADRYGNRVGFQYYEEEDCGLFWSNDPCTSIGSMIRELDLIEQSELIRLSQRE